MMDQGQKGYVRLEKNGLERTVELLSGGRHAKRSLGHVGYTVLLDK